MSDLVNQFLIGHNLSAHRSLTRMPIGELYAWYETAAYTSHFNNEVINAFKRLDELDVYEIFVLVA